MSSSPPGRGQRPCSETLAERPPHQREEVVGHRDVEMAAAAARVALAQREQDVEHGRIAAAGDVRDQGWRDHRRAVRTGGEVQQAGFGQIVEIVRRDLRLGPALAVAGDRAIDQARIDRRERRMAEPEALHHARAKLLDQHIRGSQQRHQACPRAVRFEVDSDAPLAAIEQRKAGARRAEPRLVGAQLVACRPLDLDHLRAGLGQNQAGERSGQQRAEVDDPDAGKWLHAAPCACLPPATKHRIRAMFNRESRAIPVAIRRCSFRIAAVRTGEASQRWPGLAERPMAMAFVASSLNQGGLKCREGGIDVSRSQWP